MSIALKLLFDNNLSLKLPQTIQDYFPESRHVFELNMTLCSDLEIWQFAQANNYVITTKDKDFYYLATTFGQPPKVIWILTGNCTNMQIADLFMKARQEIQGFFSDPRDILLLE